MLYVLTRDRDKVSYRIFIRVDFALFLWAMLCIAVYLNQNQQLRDKL